MKRALLTIGVIFIVLWSITPIYWALNLSLMYHFEVYSVPAHLFPEHPTLYNYLRSLGFSVFNPFTNRVDPPVGYPVKEALINSLIVASIVSLITIAIATPAGYALGRYRTKHTGLLTTLLLGSRTLPPVSILIPLYVIGLRYRLIGTIYGISVMHLALVLPLITWILMGFFSTFPSEIEKAARIDGATRLQAIIHVVIPTALPAIASAGLLSFLFSYNEYLFSWVFTSGTPAQTIQPTLASMWFMIGEINIMAASTILSLIVPIMISLYFQKYIIQVRLVDPYAIAFE
ncbi:MAG: carbohydrate ABC transporter permease [Desulfurococcaceae archaeon]